MEERIKAKFVCADGHVEMHSVGPKSELWVLATKGPSPGFVFENMLTQDIRVDVGAWKKRIFCKHKFSDGTFEFREVAKLWEDKKKR